MSRPICYGHALWDEKVAGHIRQASPTIDFDELWLRGSKECRSHEGGVRCPGPQGHQPGRTSRSSTQWDISTNFSRPDNPAKRYTNRPATVPRRRDAELLRIDSLWAQGHLWTCSSRPSSRRYVMPLRAVGIFRGSRETTNTTPYSGTTSNSTFSDAGAASLLSRTSISLS